MIASILIALEEPLRHLAVLLGDAVDVVAQVESEKGHVQPTLPAEQILHLVDLAAIEHLLYERHRKLIVAGFDRRVRRENAFLLNRLHVVVANRGSALAVRFFVEKLEREQARMSLVHVEVRELGVAKLPQHAHAADSEDHLLAEAVAIVSSVEKIRQPAVGLGVLR